MFRKYILEVQFKNKQYIVNCYNIIKYISYKNCFKNFNLKEGFKYLLFNVLIKK